MNNPFFKPSAILLLAILFCSSCVSVPKDCLRLGPDSLEKRKIQSRLYPTTDEEKIVSASAGVLQDLGFTLDESEIKLGLIMGSKDRNAVNAGQVTFATAVTVLAALGGTYSNAYETIDKEQKIRASIIIQPSQDGSNMVVRTTFQRMVWNMKGNISRVETLKDQELYTGFFEKLTKSVFLEEHQI